MIERRKLRIGVVGCGRWGRNLVRNVHEMGLLAAVSDIDAETAAAFAARYGVPALTAGDLLDADRIDAVVIAVPAEDHGKLALRAVAAGKHVFVEKPMAVSDAEALSLAAAARDRGRVLMVGHVLRYHPCFRELHRIVDAGGIGRIRHIRTVRGASRAFRRDENVLWGFAPHDISMILALTGEAPTGVAALGDCSPGRRGPDVATAVFDFPSGIRADLFVSWFNHVKEQKLIVSGETGAIVFDDCEDWESKVTIYRDGGGSDRIAVERGEPLRIECEHFVECISNGREPLTGGAEGVEVVRALAAIARSMASGGRVEMAACRPPGAQSRATGAGR